MPRPLSWLLGAQVPANSSTPTCAQRGICETEATFEQGIDFLAALFEEGLGYSAINTARSMLFSIFTLPGGTTYGTHPLVSHFLKGVHVFELKPSLLWFNTIWGVSVVLRYLKTLQPAPLSLKVPTLTLTSLLCLLSGQRCQKSVQTANRLHAKASRLICVYHMRTAKNHQAWEAYCHVAEISKKVASRLYFLRQLKRANIPAKDLLIF